MTPYYQDELTTLYNCDCKEIINELDIEMVVSDPPYGMSYHSGGYKDGNPFKKIAGDNQYPLDVLDVLLKKAKRSVYVFCRWNNLYELPKPKSCIVWVKNNGSMGDLEREYSRWYETCLFYPLENHKFKIRPSDVIHCDKVFHADMVHPTEKPVELLQKIIQVNVTDSVLDPYMGSGSTIIAARMLGIKNIGIDIEKTYCDTVIDRIKNVKRGFFS